MGDEKRGRRDDKPAKVDAKRITSLRKGGDKSKDVSLLFCAAVDSGTDHFVHYI